jgi:hypothetical protein
MITLLFADQFGALLGENGVHFVLLCHFSQEEKGAPPPPGRKDGVRGDLKDFGHDWSGEVGGV